MGPYKSNILFRLNCPADRDFTACHQFFKYLFEVGAQFISGCGMPYQCGKPAVLALVGNVGNILSCGRKGCDAFVNGVNRGMKPVEISFRLKLDHAAAIGTAIPLQGQGVFSAIKESIDKPMPPYIWTVAIGAMVRLGPWIVFFQFQKTVEINRNRHYHGITFLGFLYQNPGQWGKTALAN